MATSVTPSVESSSWNPAFRPEDDNTDSNNAPESMALDSKDHSPEVSSLSVDPSPPTTVTENTEIVSDSVLPAPEDLNTSASLDAQKPAGAADSDHQAEVNQTSNTDGIPEELEGNGVLSTRDEHAPIVSDATELSPNGVSSPSEVENPNQVVAPVEDEAKPTESQPILENRSLFPAENDEAQKSNFEDDTSWMNGGMGVTVNGKENNDHGFWVNTADANAEEDFFDQLNTQTKPIYSPPDPEARFEEGMPLLDDTVESLQSPVQPATNVESRISKIFDEDEDAEDGFFSSIQQSTHEEEQPPQITRKSTSNVLEALGIAQDPPAGESSPVSLQNDDFGEPPTSESPVKKVSSEEDLAARWEAELDDDDLLLGDEMGEDSTVDQGPVSQDIRGSVNDVVTEGLNSPFESPPRSQTTSYTPHQPSTSDLLQGLPLDGVSAASTAPAPSYFAPDVKPNPPAEKVESFVERSKEGYKSPYDLPEDLTLPRRPYKPAAPKVTSMPLPPRSSSIPVPPPPMSTSPALSTSVPPPPVTVAPPKNFYEELPLPQIPRPSSAGRYTPDRNASVPGPAQPPSHPAVNQYTSGPPPASSGRYTPDRNVSAPVPPPPVPSQYTSIQPPAPQPPGELYIQSQLQQPEKLDPYANLLAPSAPSAPSAASRYSPRPLAMQAGTRPSPSPRYSPAPPPSSAAAARNHYTSPPPSISGPPGPLPFQPRTSSPLAYSEQAAYQPQEAQAPSFELAVSLSPPRAQPQPTAGQSSPQAPNLSIGVADSGAAGVEAGEIVLPPVNQQRASLPRNPYAPQASGLSIGAADSGAAGVEAGEIVLPPVNQQRASPPRNPYAPQTYVNELSTRVDSVRDNPSTFVTSDFQNAQPGIARPFSPPRRSQTQSPGKQMLGPRLSVPSIDPLQRPASVNGPGSPTWKADPYSSSRVSIHARAPSQQLEFVPPTDGQQFDPLARWKGAPIVKFGFGGTVISCFPKHIPRYTPGQVAPMIKSSSGEVKICQLNDWVSIAESIVRHPGPLKAKSKKKDILAWMSSKIAAFENEGLSEFAQLHPDPYKHHDERILLWKIIRILVENDGVLEGSTDVQKSVRSVISPNLQSPEAESPYGNGFTPSNSIQRPDAPTRPDSVDTHFMGTLRNNLLNGEREKAVWGAVDNRLWGHALIIASTLDKSVWKQVVQEFVKREVRSESGSAESLAALYEIFAGNIEESVDELVPPSVRAGLQMVSKFQGQAPTRDALAGLDSWRDTLQLVLSNPSPDGHQALLALGRLLSNYGRTEAAHICYLFSRAPGFGGADDPLSNIVLLGVDHRRFPATLLDEDSILLTEVYEYATSVLAGAPTATLPHLLVFKLMYAKSIAQRGRKSDALQYCDAIAASLKTATKPSAYYHQYLFSEVDELSARLKQITSDGASSWISRPSMEKVSGSVWAKFNSFVSGEDNDAASTGSGKAGDADIGPFAKVTGTPTISRSPSVSDLYGSYPFPGAQPIPNGGSSRYHPGNQYAQNGSPDHYRGRSSLDSQRSGGSYGFSFGQRRGSQEPSTPIETNPYQPGSLYSSPPTAGYHPTPPQTTYMPLAPVEEDRAYQANASIPPPTSSIYAFDSIEQRLDNQDPTNVPQPSNYGYMPPVSTGGYEPPSNGIAATSVLENTESLAPDEPKKKSLVDDDDDDDIAARAAAIQKAEKERADREADEAFKKAAEADAKKAQPAKKGWFSGWFGGKKDNNANSGGGPVRAKLGEANSFYYDKELKKWVNKKDPNSASSAHSTPPPPKGPAPPTSSATSSVPPMAPGPQSKPPSVAGGPPALSGTPAPPSSSVPLPPAAGTTPRSVPTPSGPAMSVPPLRSGTSLSNATSIDDLLGAPQARKGPAAKGRKKGRGYVDVMAK